MYQTIQRTIDENINAAEDRFRIEPEYLGAIPYEKQKLHTAESQKKPLLEISPHIKASQSIEHMCKRFCTPEDEYSPEVKYTNRLKRFAAILSQKS